MYDSLKVVRVGVSVLEHCCFFELLEKKILDSAGSLALCESRPVGSRRSGCYAIEN